ncbi:MAG: alpha/beta hydrolase [Nocardiopsaceae bacterium]|nr:alpha/beta hydrolase [Nocardiopsaceae bacterium]
MSVLSVPGARLYYETLGSGPLMVLIPGANGDGRVFGPVASHLAGHYTVLTYDRRGFSRSELAGPQDYERRLATDADDVRRLIEHVGDEPATVFGTSCGGVIALEFLARYPASVGMLVPHEPAAMTLLPDARQWLDFFRDTYGVYRRSGTESAFMTFRERVFPDADMAIMAQATTNRELNDLAYANAMYWFERELCQYTAAVPDIAALTLAASRIVPTAGSQSRGYPIYRVSVELARKLGSQLVELPGGHVGYVTQPAEFATDLIQALLRATPASQPRVA